VQEQGDVIGLAGLEGRGARELLAVAQESGSLAGAPNEVDDRGCARRFARGRRVAVGSDQQARCEIAEEELVFRGGVGRIERRGSRAHG
jgi:hypothetical protein